MENPIPKVLQIQGFLSPFRLQFIWWNYADMFLRITPELKQVTKEHSP